MEESGLPILKEELNSMFGYAKAHTNTSWIRECYMKIKAKFPPPKQHKVVIPPIDRLPEFDPSKVKKRDGRRQNKAPKEDPSTQKIPTG